MDINSAKTSSISSIASSVDRQWLVRSNTNGSLDVQSRKLVSQFFFGTMLKQVRSSSMGTGIFDGGSGGKSFQAMLDQRISEGMSNTPAGRKIAESLVQSLSPLKSDRNLPNSLDEARKSRPARHHAGAVKRSPKAAAAFAATSAASILTAGASSVSPRSTDSIDTKG
jgi:Rod binding domain-containing protein